MKQRFICPIYLASLLLSLLPLPLPVWLLPSLSLFYSPHCIVCIKYAMIYKPRQISAWVLKSAQFVCIKCRTRGRKASRRGGGEGEGRMSGREKEQQRQSKVERERRTFDCVKLYVMTPTASAPGTVLNGPPFPAAPLCTPLPSRQLHMLIHSRIHTAIHPWPARSFPCTVGRRVSLDICQRRGRKST